MFKISNKERGIQNGLTVNPRIELNWKGRATKKAQWMNVQKKSAMIV